MKKLVVIAIAIFCVATMFFIARAQIKVHEKENRAALYAALLKDLRVNDNDDFYARIDKARRFVHANSIHKIDAEFRSYWGDDYRIIELFQNKVSGVSKTGPHLECSSRTGILRQLLTLLHYDMRTIAVYKLEDGFPSHVFLEVKNPKDDSWSVADPDFDIFWRINATSKRASIHDLVSLPFSAFEPCLNNKQCGWHIINDEGRKTAQVKNALNYAVVTDDKDERGIVMNDAFDLKAKRKASDGKLETFCQATPKNCRGNMEELRRP